MKKTIILLGCIACFGVASAQVASPFISYPVAAQTFNVGVAISAFGPTNTGGPIPATVPATVTTFAGSSYGYADGTGTAAQFYSPSGIATDASGNVYVSDQNSHRIRKITSVGVVTTLAGSGNSGNTDGTGVAASFSSPRGLVVDASGVVFVCDYGNHRIRKITAEGVVTTIAGSTQGFAEGTGTSAQFNNPWGISIDASGNLYVTDYGNNRIRKITAAGVVTTFAGGSQGFANGLGTSAQFNFPTGIAIDAAGSFYVADMGNHRIRKITSVGMVSSFAGDGTAGIINGTRNAARFRNPYGLATDALGNIFVTDYGNNLIRKITNGGVVSTLAGSGALDFADGVGNAASFYNVISVATDASGNLFVTDQANSRVRKIITTGYSISPALPAGLSFDATTGFISGTPTEFIPSTLFTVTAINSAGSCSASFTISVTNTIPSVTTSIASSIGSTTTTANGAIIDLGTSSNPTAYGVCYSSGNSLPTTADLVVGKGATSSIGNFTASLTGLTPSTLYYLRAFATNSGGTAYGTVVTFKTIEALPSISYSISSSLLSVNVAIAPIAPTNNGGAVPATIPGNVTTFAGSTSGFTNATGVAAQFFLPTGVTTDASGNVYVADRNNNSIRKITPEGVVTTLAGNSTAGYADRTGIVAMFNYPLSVATDVSGNVFVADYSNNRIRKISTEGVVTTLAGSMSGYSDGIGSNAQFNGPAGVATDPSGNVFVADYVNHRIRKITPSGVVTTFAGSGSPGFANGTGTAAIFNYPLAVATDASGNVYVADKSNQRIRKITPDGVVTSFAGTSSTGSSDGIGSMASFYNPSGVTTDAAGNVYVADAGNHRIRKISPAGNVTTLAGSTQGSTDGIGSGAFFNSPNGVATDVNNNVFVADYLNNRIRKISTCGYSISPALPAGLSFDATTGIIGGTPTVFSPATQYTVTAINSGGTSSTSFTLTVQLELPSISTYGVNDIGSVSATANGMILDLGSASTITSYGICYSSSNSVPTISDIVINKGATSTVGSFTASLTGLSLSTLYYARAFATNSGGTVYGDVAMFKTTEVSPSLSYSSGSVVYEANVAITPLQAINSGGTVPSTSPGTVSAFAGNATGGFSDATGILAQFNNPFGVTMNTVGIIYVADYFNHRIRKITPEGVVTTLAGNGTAALVNGTGTNAQFSYPKGVAIDIAGNVYVADQNNNCIRKITPDGVTTTFAGSGVYGFADGIGIAAQFYQPSGVATDLAGNVYVADANNNRIRKISSSGVVTTFAGSGLSGSADGTGTSATFNYPQGVATDASGNVYVADCNNHRIRKITPVGVVTTLAGNGSLGIPGGNTDGTGMSASFNYPQGVATDLSGNVYVADRSNHRIRKITPSGVVSTLAGGAGGYADGVGNTALFNSPNSVTVDASGNLFVADGGNNRIRKILTAGYNISPTLPIGFAFDATTGVVSGTPTAILSATNYTLTATNSGGSSSASLSMSINSAIPTLSTSAEISVNTSTATIKGAIVDLGTSSNPSAYGICYSTTNSTPNLGDLVIDKGATTVTGNFTVSLAGLTAGTLYYVRSFATNSGGTGYGEVGAFNTIPIAPTLTYPSSSQTYFLNTAITPFTPINNGGAVTPSVIGTVTTMAGNGSAGSVDGTGTSATFNYPQGVATDASGNVYVADKNNNRIRKITPAGVVTTLAGNSSASYVDGVGSAASFNYPGGVATDAIGNVFVADQNNHRIRKITPSGIVTTLAGSGAYGYVDGTGTSAQFYNPIGVATDASGNVYVADQSNNRIRKINAAGVVTTLAGSSLSGYADGLGDAAKFMNITGIGTDASGNVYVVEKYNHRIRKITPAGMVSTIAGSSGGGFADGTGSFAMFNTPYGVTTDISGNIYVADYNNYRIRKSTPAGVVTTLAGNGTYGSTDGVGTSSSFSSVTSVATDAFGNVYVADQGNQRIRKIAIGGYSINPALPAGLSLDVNTGSISGTPSVFTLPTSYTITATNGGGTSSSSFTIAVQRVEPTLTTNRVSGISTTFVTANGSILDLGSVSNPTSYGVCYSSSNATPTTSDLIFDKGPVSVTGDYSATLTGLNPGTQYYVRAYATNTGGTGYGEVVIFKTTSTVAPAINFSVESMNCTLNEALTPFAPTNNGGAVPAWLPGVVTTIAGSGTAGFADATGPAAQFNNPYGVATDASGNVYVSDQNNYRIRKITPAGVVTTLAGGTYGSADGTGAAAQFNGPTGLAMDASDNLFVADMYNNRIRKITPAGVVTTLAGSTYGYADGNGASAKFQYPIGVATDASGNVYVADKYNNRIRKISPGGVVTTFAGSGTSGIIDGVGLDAQFNSPSAITTDATGNVYVAESNQAYDRIRKITPAGVVTTLAGSTVGMVDGTGAFSMFYNPTGLAADVLGNVYVTEQRNNRIRKVTPSGNVSTLAGSTQGYTDATGINALFYNPYGIAIDPSGNLYIADQSNQRIRKISTAGYSISPPLPSGLSFDATTGTISGTLDSYVAASTYTVAATNEGGSSAASFNLLVNNPVPTITTAIVNTIGTTSASAGGTIIDLGSASNPTSYGVCYSSVNSMPTTADILIDMGAVSLTGSYTASLTGLAPLTLYNIRAFATNTAGTVYGEVRSFCTKEVAPAITYSAEKVSYHLNVVVDPFLPTNTGGALPSSFYGNVSTLAGSIQGCLDENGSSAQFNLPTAVAIDASGNVYVTDQKNYRIRKVSSLGAVTNFAGSIQGFLDGSGSAAQFGMLQGLVTDISGNVFVVDAGNNRIRKITPEGVVSTFAGSSSSGYLDGVGTAAKFYNPYGIAIDKAGNLYVSDQYNHRIRKITPVAVVTTLAGSGFAGFRDGTGLWAAFNNPQGVATDVSGNVYVADASNNRIRKITPDGIVTTFAGSTSGYVDAIGAAAQFYAPKGLVADASGNLFVTENGMNNTIRKITPTGVVTTFVGTYATGFADGTGSQAQFNNPQGMAIDATGNLFLADYGNHRIRKITPNGYAINAALPAGLSFASTGSISGTPSTLAEATNYTVTAVNTGGASTASFQLTVPTFWTGASSSDWSVAGNWDAGLPVANFDALIANATNQPTISGAAACNNLVIDAGSSVTISAAAQLNVAGSITNNAGVTGIVVKASPSAPNGTLIFHNAPEAPVSATVEMYSKASWDLNQAAGSKFRWQFFGVPVRTQVFNPTVSGAIVRRADEAGMTLASTWVQLAGTSTLSSFTGYEIVQSAPKTYTFTGQLENGSLNKTLTYTSGAVTAGEHLVANPYTAAIAISQLVFTGAAESSVYLYNTGTLNEWTTNLGVFDGTNPGQYTVSTPATAGSGGIPSQIPSMQAFLVQTPSNAAASLQIPYSAVVTGNTSQLRAAKTSSKVFSIIDVKGNRFGDRMWLFSDPSCSRGFDNGWDGRKKFGSTLTPQLFAMELDGNYQIDAVSDINQVELGFQAGEDTQYTLSFTHENMEATYGSIYLVDLNTNRTTDITASGSEYTFTAVPTAAPEKRFRIVTIATALMNPKVESLVKISSYDRTVVVQNASAGKGDLMLYDVAGRLVQTISYNANAKTTKALNLAAGMYVARAVGSDKAVTIETIVLR